MTSLFDIQVTLGHKINSHTVKQRTLPRHLCMKHTVFKGKLKDKNGYYVCPALMSGTTRGKDYAKRCTIIALDLDVLTPNQGERLKIELAQSGLEYLMYSTAGHKARHPRYRVLLNPSRLMSEREYKCTVTYLAEHLRIDVLDACSFITSQPAFLPMVLEGNEDDTYLYYQEGATVDVAHYTQNIDDFEAIEEYSDTETLEPMAIPGGLNEHAWLTCVLNAWPATGLEYYQWMYVGFAIYHQTDGRGFDLWFDWSAENSEKHCRDYDRAEMLYKFNSGDERSIRRKGLTLRYILNQRSATGRSAAALAYIEFLKLCTTAKDISALRGDIQDDTFLSTGDISQIATTYMRVLKKETGEACSRGEAMQVLRHDLRNSEPKTLFYDRYMFNRREAVYYDIETKEDVPIVSLNFQYGNRMPPSANGDPKIVHRVLTTQSNGFVQPRLMSGIAYVVNGPNVISEEGTHYLNVYKPLSWPTTEQTWSPEDDLLDQEIFKMINLHLSLLCNNDQSMIRMITQHLGHLRQKPNERIHFAYAISSYYQGAGKSTLRQIYEAVLGAAQVNVVSADDIMDRFNSYAGAPHLMTFIEEFEFENRRDQNRAIKRMKDLITSDRVSLTEKYKSTRASTSYTAYAMFSNDEYVLGHESGGRRWVPIVVEAMNDDQCKEVLGQHPTAFYKRYHNLLKDHPDRFVAYFDQIEIDDFDKEKPPVNREKQAYVSNVPAARCVRLIRDIMDECITIDVCPEFISYPALCMLFKTHIALTESSDTDALSDMGSGSINSLIKTSLRAMGYRQVDKTSTKRVRLPFSNAIRTRLDEVWVMDYKRFGSEDNISKLRRRMDYAIKERQAAIDHAASGVARKPPSHDDDFMDF